MKKSETVRMLTTKEAGEKISADPGTVRMWCINGTFANAKQEETPRGPIWLIPETDLDGFERRSRGRPPKPTDADSEEASAPEVKPTRATKKAGSKKPTKKSGKKAGKNNDQ